MNKAFILLIVIINFTSCETHESNTESLTIDFDGFYRIENITSNENVNFIMISDESIEKISNFSKSHSYSFIYLRSTKDLTEYGINLRPTTYFYNTSGELITKHSSSLDKESLKKLIEEIK